MSHPFIDQISNIIDLGTSAVQAHQIEVQELDSLIAELSSAETAFLSQIPRLKSPDTRSLNLLIQEIDEIQKIGTLLPGQKVEQLLSEKYILTDTSKHQLTTDERTIIVRVLNKLANEGLQYINKKITDSRSIAAILSDVKDHALAAISAAIPKTVTLENQRSIIDPASITGLLLEPEQVLGLTSLEIKGNTIRGSQAVHDFTYNFKEGTRELASITFTETSTEKFTPLQNISSEFSSYLLSIAKDVLGEDEYDKIIQDKNGILITPNSGPQPIGQVSIETLREDVINILKKLLPTYSSIIERFSPQIAIGRSLSNIRGFLGEMRAALLMYELFGDSAVQLVATGLQDKIRMSEDGALQEAPIDFVVQALNTLYGFQVKNTIDTSYSWEGEMSAGSFYLQRLQVEMSDEEKRFYGAFSYNQPISRKDVDYSELNDWKEYEQNIYKGFERNFNSVFSQVFKSLSPNIIRLLTRTQGGNIGIFEGQNVLKNNFFIMQDKIIAASDILKAFKNGQSVSSKFSMVAGQEMLWKNGDPSPLETKYNPNLTKIDYNVTLNYKTLFRSAYNLS